MAQRVLAIVYTHENNALLCASRDYNAHFHGMGYECAVVDVSRTEDIQRLSQEIATGEVAFCFGLQGIGSNLKSSDRNLWSEVLVPFIGLHYDNPCYNLHNHGNVSPWVANIYHAELFLDIQQRFIGGDQINMALPFRITAPMDPGDIPFAERPVKYLYLKNGEQFSEMVEYFDGLPPFLRDGVWNIIRQAEANPNLVLCDLVKALLIAGGYEPDQFRTQFWAVVQAVDFYIRRKRSIDMVNWLKKQPDAVIIGDGWDFIDREGAQAVFRPGMPLEEAVHLYPQTQFVFNTTPYGSDIIHERIISGLMRNSCVISDTNQWWDRHFTHVPALLRLDLNQPFDEQILPFVSSDPAARAATGRKTALQWFAPQDNYAHIVACAEKTRLHARTRSG